MTREDFNDLILGALAIGAAYFAYQHWKAKKAAPTPPPTIAAGEPMPARNPYGNMADLVHGSIHDLGGGFMADDFMQGFMAR